MVMTLQSPESAAFQKPVVAVIGDSEEMPGAIESCKNRLEFVGLNAIPQEPNFWSVRQISGVVIFGLNWFTRFLETKPCDELGVVVAVNNLDEFSAAVGAGASSFSGSPRWQDPVRGRSAALESGCQAKRAYPLLVDW